MKRDDFYWLLYWSRRANEIDHVWWDREYDPTADGVYGIA